MNWKLVSFSFQDTLYEVLESLKSFCANHRSSRGKISVGYSKTPQRRTYEIDNYTKDGGPGEV